MGRRKRFPVDLSDAERDALILFVSRGKRHAREITRARMLLLADEGKQDEEIVKLLGIVRATVISIRRKYCAGGYAHILDVLKDAPRTGRPIEVDTRVASQITAIACSDPPEGSCRWTLHMIADRLVRLEVVDSISHESVRQALKKTD